LDQALGAPPCTLYGKTFTFEADLFNNKGLNVELPNDFFSLVGNQLLVPTAQVIQTAVAADPATEMLGPYAAGDAGTVIVRVRKIIPIPFSSTTFIHKWSFMALSWHAPPSSLSSESQSLRLPLRLPSPSSSVLWH